MSYKEIINENSSKTQDQNLYNPNLKKNKIFHHVLNSNNIVNFKKSGEYSQCSLELYLNDIQTPKLYKPWIERNEIKKHSRKIYIPIIKKPNTLSIGNVSQERKIIPFNKNNYQQVNINNNIFNSYIIPSRRQTDIFSFRAMDNII